MAANDAATVWLYATEEEHDAFQTEDEMIWAYSEDFPVLTLAKSVDAEREWQEGDATFVAVKLADAGRNQVHRDDGILAQRRQRLAADLVRREAGFRSDSPTLAASEDAHFSSSWNTSSRLARIAGSTARMIAASAARRSAAESGRVTKTVGSPREMIIARRR